MILVMPVLSQNNAVFLQVPTGLNPSQSQNKMLALLCQVSFPFDSALSHSQHSLTRSFRKRLKRSCGVKLYNTQPSYCLLHMNNYYTSLQCPFNIFQSLTSFSVGSQTRSWWLFLCETSTASWRCGDSTEMRSFRWSKGKLQHFSFYTSKCFRAAGWQPMFTFSQAPILFISTNITSKSMCQRVKKAIPFLTSPIVCPPEWQDSA